MDIIEQDYFGLTYDDDSGKQVLYFNSVYF